MKCRFPVRVLFIWVGLLFLLCVPGVLALHASEKASADEYMKRGKEFSLKGDFEQAIANEREAARLYREEGKGSEEVEALTRLGRHHQLLGQYEKSLEPLETALLLARERSDKAQTASILGHLGNAHIHIGPPEKAEELLNEGLVPAKSENRASIAASILDYQGSWYVLQERYGDALATYKEGIVFARKAGDSLPIAQLSVNAAVASMRNESYGESEKLLASALEKFRSLPPSHDKAYGLIQTAQGYRRLSTHFHSKNSHHFREVARHILHESADVADAIGDHRAASYAFGYLGQLDEEDHHYEDALAGTRKAIFSAQQVGAREALYLWEWQTGRLFKAEGRVDDAIVAYRTAIDTLQSIRREMTAGCNTCSRSSFRESGGPIYYEMADLLLKRAASLKEQKKMEPYLLEARETIELLKTAELRDYFQDPCVDAYQSKTERLDTIAGDTAVIYIISLSDRLELLVSLPSGMKRFASPVTADALTEEVRLLRRSLEKRTTWEYLPPAQKLYDWLIRPLKAELTSRRITTLVFVPDGALRTIPMAALHDGEQFLISRFAVVTTPGLTLTDPQPIERKKVKVLLAGLTEPVLGFPPLVNVDQEMNEIRDLYGGTVLQDQDFLVDKMKDALKEKSYSIVHMATHGEFAGEVKRTYLLAWDNKLSMDQLDHLMKVGRFRQKPVELLTLSACQTAAGDDRAALGLAGVAVKAGARSALATLWYVSDEATSELVVEFYHQLQDESLSKSKALQEAQLKLINNPRYRHPYYWSPFLLIGNWL